MKPKNKQIIKYTILILIISFLIFSFHYTAKVTYDNLEHDFGTGVAFGVAQTMTTVCWCLLLIVIVRLIHTIFKNETKETKKT